MSFFKITLARSSIGLPFRTRRVLYALGLHKRGRTVYQPVSGQSAGMIMRVKELLTVEEVKEGLTFEEIRKERKTARGFVVSGNVRRGGGRVGPA